MESSPASKSKTVGGAAYSHLCEGGVSPLAANASSASIQKGNESQQSLLPNHSKSELPETDNNEIVTILSPLKYRSFNLILPFYALFELASYLKYVFIAAYGAAWFGGCRTIKENDDCDKTFDYNTFNLWNNVSLSALCVVAFLCSGFVGALSDSYGRRPFMYFQIITTALPNLYMVFFDNFWIYFGLYLLIGLNGTSLPTGPVSSAMIADILPQNYRMMGYAYYYILGGFGLGVGSVIGFLIAIYMGDHFNFYVIVAIFILCMFYMLVFPETLPKENRKPVNRKLFKNPFLPLWYMKKNPVVLWMSFLYLIVSLPDTGLMNIVIVVFSNTFNSDTEQKSNTIAILYLGGLTVGLLFAPFVALPILKCCCKTDYKVLIVSTFILAFCMLFMAMVVIVSQLWMVALVGFSFGHSYLCQTAASSILVEYVPDEDRGQAFGCVNAIATLGGAVAPTLFAVLYNYLNEYHVSFGVYLIALIMVVFGLWIELFPLKKAIKEVHDNKEKYGIDVKQHSVGLP